MKFLNKKSLYTDKEIFIREINTCTPTMYKIGKSMLRNDDDIGDAIGDTILSSYQNINSLNHEKYFKTWIIRIFINNCNKILNTYKPNIHIDSVYNLSYKDNSIQNFELKEAIESLKIDYKLVITLYYIMGFSIKEISFILDQKEGTIKSKLSRARNDLRSFYTSNKEAK